jgi:hypothetical protein
MDTGAITASRDTDTVAITASRDMDTVAIMASRDMDIGAITASRDMDTVAIMASRDTDTVAITASRDTDTVAITASRDMDTGAITAMQRVDRTDADIRRSVIVGRKVTRSTVPIIAARWGIPSPRTVAVIKPTAGTVCKNVDIPRIAVTIGAVTADGDIIPRVEAMNTVSIIGMLGADTLGIMP